MPIYLQPFIAELVRQGRGTTDEIRARYAETALGSARRVFGDDAPVVVSIGGPFEAIRFVQSLAIVDRVVHPRREIAAADAASLPFGECIEQRFEVSIDDGMQDHDEITAAQAEFGRLLPLPLMSYELWDTLAVDLNRALLDDFPAEPFADGTIGALLQGGGGWLVGLSATRDGVTLTVKGAALAHQRNSPTALRTTATLVLTVAGADPQPADDLAPDGAWTLATSAEAGIFAEEGRQATGPEATEAFVAALGALASQVAAKGTARVYADRERSSLMAAALRPAAEGSLMRWCEREFPALFVGRVMTAVDEKTGERSVMTVVNTTGPTVTVIGPGLGRLQVRIEAANGNVVTQEVRLGWPTSWSMEGGPRDASDEADLRALAVRSLDQVPVETLRARARGFTPSVPLLSLMEARLRHGAPGDAPVPELTDDLRARAAAVLREPSPDGLARATAALKKPPLRVVEAHGYLLAFGDRTEGVPFSDPWITLLAPGEEAWCEVLRVDVWDPSGRAVVDGDAFAFERFVEWVRAGVMRTDLDATLRFVDGAEGGEKAAVPTMLFGREVVVEKEPDADVVEMKFSEWLRLGEPFDGDRFRYDWRVQGTLVAPGLGIGRAFGGIYGMSPEKLETLATRDAAAWRRFLREVVDPRFDYVPYAAD